MKRKLTIIMDALCCLTLLFGCGKSTGKSEVTLLNPEVPALSISIPQTAKSDAYENYLTLDNQWENYGIGDPYILKYNGKFYLYVSTPYGKKGVKVWQSSNAFDWEYAGIVAENDDATFTAYSPKVMYYNGKFYLYTAPNGNGLYVLTSDSPIGPFGNAVKIHDSIDACIFVDDDGTWYIGHGHAIDGIEYHKMKSPTEIISTAYYPGAGVFGNGGNQWTETGNITKHDGVYFMTYSGNHVANYSYRTLWASSDKVVSGYKSGDNPLLSATYGKIQGTGCGLVFTGANLVDDYVVYHNLLNPNVGPIRALNIDRVNYNGYEMTAFGPTVFSQDKGQMPTSYDYLKTPDNFTGLSGVEGGFGQAVAGNAVVYNYSTNAEYVAEVNYNANGGDSELSFSDGAVKFTAHSNGRLTLNVNGSTLNADYTGYDSSTLHVVKTDFSKNRVRVYIDGMLKFDTDATCVGGKISLKFSEGGKVGFTAITQLNEYTDITESYVPYTGKLFAKDYAKDISSDLTVVDYTGGAKAVNLKTNQYARFRIQTGNQTEFSAVISYKAQVGGQAVIVDKQGKVIAGTDYSATNGKYTTAVISGITLDTAKDVLTLAVSKGEMDLYSIQLYATTQTPNTSVGTIAENGFTKIDGKWTAIGGKVKAYYQTTLDQANVVFGDERMADYKVSVKMTIDDSSFGKAGILIRTVNIAEITGNKHSIFSNNDQCYFVYVDTNGSVGIDKHNYNSVRITYDRNIKNAFSTIELTAICKQNVIEVYVNGKKCLSYTDTDNPYLTGKVGLHSDCCTVTFTDFTVSAL